MSSECSRLVVQRWWKKTQEIKPEALSMFPTHTNTHTYIFLHKNVVFYLSLCSHTTPLNSDTCTGACAVTHKGRQNSFSYQTGTVQECARPHPLVGAIGGCDVHVEVICRKYINSSSIIFNVGFARQSTVTWTLFGEKSIIDLLCVCSYTCVWVGVGAWVRQRMEAWERVLQCGRLRSCRRICV